MAKRKKKGSEEVKVKLVEVWPLHKLEKESAPKGSHKIQFDVSWLGIPQDKISEAWAQNLLWEDTISEANEELVKYILSIAEPGDSNGLVRIASSSIARKLVNREEAIHGRLKAAGTTSDGTHIWSSSLIGLNKKVIGLGGKWSAGISKFSIKGCTIHAEVWFLPGTGFYSRIEDSDIDVIYKPTVELYERDNS